MLIICVKDISLNFDQSYCIETIGQPNIVGLSVFTAINPYGFFLAVDLPNSDTKSLYVKSNYAPLSGVLPTSSGVPYFKYAVT